MPAIGPQLPPTLSDKRKRDDEDEKSSSDSDSDIGPAPSVSSESTVKRPKVIGPTIPADIATTPVQVEAKQPTTQSVDDEDSDSSEDEDDGFGPSLPPPKSSASTNNNTVPQSRVTTSTKEAPSSTKRDDWMMVPPSGGDWSARVDPTKLKNRKFNTGKGAKAPPTAGDASNTWHETPAEKQARLQREMMGIKSNSSSTAKTPQETYSSEDKETAKRMRDYNKSRGPALYTSHQARDDNEQDDDPSARAFDREKDIGGGLQINATQRRDMMKKASDFGSRFGSAKYL